MRLHRTWKVNWGFHPQVRDAVLHNLEIDGYDSGHLDGATEGDLAVALGEVEITDGEFGAFYVHGEEDFASAGEVLDVAVSSVFGAAWVLLDL